LIGLRLWHAVPSGDCLPSIRRHGACSQTRGALPKKAFR
jgi:hypothetical protein